MEHVWNHSQSGCYLDLDATLKRQLTRCDIPHSSLLNYLVVSHDCAAERCCLYRAMLRAELPRSLVNGKFVKGWCLLNTLAFYLFRSPPNVVHHRGCPLASLHRGCCNPVHRGCCNPGCLRAPKPYVHPSGQRKAQGSHYSRSGGFTAMVCGKLLNTQPGTLYNMHLSVTKS